MSKTGADWYPREPHRYLGGVRGMTERQHAVYSVILDLIYAYGGSCPNDPKWISGWFADIGPAAVRNTIAELNIAEKLQIEGDNLTNKLAQNVVKTKVELRENRKKTGRLGGISSGKSRSKHNENNALGEPNGSTTARLDKRREEKERKKEDFSDFSKGKNANGAGSATQPPVSEPRCSPEAAAAIIARAGIKLKKV